jgi:hypothetical protein
VAGVERNNEAVWKWLNGIQATIILAGLALYFSGYTNFVPKADLLRMLEQDTPYVRDRPLIVHRMNALENSQNEIRQTQIQMQSKQEAMAFQIVKMQDKLDQLLELAKKQ